MGTLANHVAMTQAQRFIDHANEAARQSKKAGIDPMSDSPQPTEMLGFRDVDIATSLFEACEEGEEIAVRAIMSRLRFERNKERVRCLNILDEEGWLGCSRERIASGTGSDEPTVQSDELKTTDDRYRAGQLAMMHRAALAVMQSNLSFDRELLGAIREKILDLTVVDDPLRSNVHAE